MSSNKNRAASQSKSGKSQGSVGPFCPSCGARAVGRFCHACGVDLDRATKPRKWPAQKLAGIGVIAGVAAAGLAIAVYTELSGPPPAEAPPRAPAFSSAGTPPAGAVSDISQLSPREAADRLFNRVMASAEEGNVAEALRFAPMAIAAYDRVPSLDHDAHYHLGLIHAVTGDRVRRDQEIAALRQGSPNHLLALSLEHDAAEKAGDAAGVARVRAAFAAAYPSEIAQPRPEYEAHRNTIERLYAAAAGPSARVAAVTGVTGDGALAFAAKCAICHGPAGSGTDKGPPLVHKIYEPSHHNDESFRRAVRQGVAQHHWSFGDMAPVPDVSNAEIGSILAYVRDLQRAVGIR